MSQDPILCKVTDIFRDILDDETVELSRGTTADDIEDWDSLAHISIIIAIEKEFHIKFDLEELKPMENVGEMLDLIRQKISSPGYASERYGAATGAGIA